MTCGCSVRWALLQACAMALRPPRRAWTPVGESSWSATRREKPWCVFAVHFPIPSNHPLPLSSLLQVLYMSLNALQILPSRLKPASFVSCSADQPATRRWSPFRFPYDVQLNFPCGGAVHAGGELEEWQCDEVPGSHDEADHGDGVLPPGASCAHSILQRPGGGALCACCGVFLCSLLSLFGSAVPSDRGVRGEEMLSVNRPTVTLASCICAAASVRRGFVGGLSTGGGGRRRVLLHAPSQVSADCCMCGGHPSMSSIASCNVEGEESSLQSYACFLVSCVRMDGVVVCAR